MNWKWLLHLLVNQIGWSTEMAVTGIADIDDSIPEHWAKGILVDGDRESFWGSLTGKEGSRLPCINKTGPLRQSGDTLVFNTLSQLMGAGVTGDSVLKGNEESMSVGSFTVGCDVVRHAVGIQRRANKQANFDMVQNAGTLLKQWMTRKMDNDRFTEIIDNSTNTLYSNSAAGVDYLADDSSHEFGMTEIEMIRLALQRQGADPIQVVKSNKRTVGVYGIVLGEIEEYRIHQNSTFLQTIREAWNRFNTGNKHPLFNDVIGMYRDCLIYRYYGVNPIPQGTPLRPESIVYATLTTTATHISVGGPTNATGVTPNYTLFFASTGSLQIEDEVLTYEAKTANTFTTVGRGCPEYFGASATTAAQHSNNKFITQRNIASVIGFGAEAIFTAVGDEPEPIGEKDDYGEQTGLGIRAYYGNALKTDSRRTTTKNVVVMKCWSENPSTV